MSSSTATTQGIRVDVQSRLLTEQSAPDEGHWFFVYGIRIHNLSDQTVQLVSREWTITNAAGRIEIVRGPGVVGQQPTLRPQESFEYASGCPLDTPFGTMQGKYRMVNAAGEAFDVDIAEFALIDPDSLN